GYFLAGNPHSSFFYLLSGVHAVHVGGGLAWFLTVLWALRAHGALSARAGRSLSLRATYWHFLGGLWLYGALVIFSFWEARWRRAATRRCWKRDGAGGPRRSAPPGRRR